MPALIRRHFGLCLGLVLLMPPCIILCCGPAQAQKFGPAPVPAGPKVPVVNPPKVPVFNPPKVSGGMPNQPFVPGGVPNQPPMPVVIPNSPPQAPVFITVWHCSRCQTQLGQGNTKPALDKCPQCGALFTNGAHTVAASQISVPSSTSVPNPTMAQANFNSTPFVVAGSFFALITAGIMVSVVVVNASRT
jgi:hypothetical protein